jgi:hypothetical protein
MQKLKVLITVKTYPIPSSKYDELVCTAGVTQDGEFIRLYPINFRDLPYTQKFKKYQWIEVMAEKHRQDSRKESYRPDNDTLVILGEPISTKRGWAERAKYALANKAQSMEELYDRQAADKTSLGVFRPKQIHDLVIEPAEPQWKPKFLEALKQARLWEDRKVTKQPPRKVPYKFSYRFECDDERCNGKHKMMIEDWEVGALYWRLVDGGANPDDAAAEVRKKFLDDLCGPDKDPHFYVGTILAHPKSWVIIGVFRPKKITAKKRTRKKKASDKNLRLFDDD